MRKATPLPALVLVLLAGCQQQVVPPTAQELLADRPLLAEWQAKCDTGEYSHLSGAEYSRVCASTHDASMTAAATKAGKRDSDFFGGMAKRK